MRRYFKPAARGGGSWKVWPRIEDLSTEVKALPDDEKCTESVR